MEESQRLKVGEKSEKNIYGTLDGVKEVSLRD